MIMKTVILLSLFASFITFIIVLVHTRFKVLPNAKSNLPSNHLNAIVFWCLMHFFCKLPGVLMCSFLPCSEQKLWLVRFLHENAKRRAGDFENACSKPC